MIHLDKHIEILMMENDCVIVPGLGGFMTHYAPARYDEEDGLFLPPQRTVGFNPQLTMNDSLLAQQYVEAYDISYPDALKRIEAEVAELRQHLDSDGAIELSGIGILTIGEEGQLMFEPCAAGILTPWLYGLDAFSMVATDTVKQTDDAEKKVAGEPKPSVGRDTLTIPLSWIRNTVAAMAAVVVFFLMLTPVANSRRDSQQHLRQSSFFPFNMGNAGTMVAEPVKTHAAETDAEAETETEAEAEKQPEGENSTPAKQAELTVAEPLQQPVEPVAEKQTWTLVVASYVTKQGAGQLVSRLARQGMSAGQVYTYNNVTRAIYGSYSSQDEARSALKQLRQQDTVFAEAWVMEMKNGR
ncbi:MAG: SPOR domain-containing protein [Prevotella sp.]|nr:SPOR domain-containing protein [Prevotella sp.]